MLESEIIQLFYEDGKAQVLDDCAFLACQKEGSLHTTDGLVEGTHFHLNWSEPSHLASKLLHVNISDILSSGGIPRYAFLNLGIPKSLPDSFLERFATALRRELSLSRVELLGGDSFRAPVLFLGLHLIGVLSPFCGSKPIERSGGKPGEWLYLTGDIGRSLLGYQLLSKLEESFSSIEEKGRKEQGRHEEKKENIVNDRTSIPADKDLEAPFWKAQFSFFSDLEQSAIERHLAPRAREDISVKIFEKYRPSAMVDISDGLVLDASRLAKASGLCLEIDLSRLPVQKALDLDLEDALVSGEELELLFLSSVAPDKDILAQVHLIGRSLPRPEGEEITHTGALRFVKQGKELILQDFVSRGFRHW